MKILDKNTDYYDYLQNVYPDATFTFDRRSSFILTKEEIACHIRQDKGYALIDSYNNNRKCLLIQVCNTFWLLPVVGSVFDYGFATKMEIESVVTWKNYNLPRKLFSVKLIEFTAYSYFTKKRHLSIQEYLSDKIARVNTNDYDDIFEFTHFLVPVHGRDFEYREYPILKETGIPKFIEPEEIYHAFEEYFSAEKTATERTESTNITDKEKIQNHGFDTKASFRNIK